jgi:hypothetical protein
LRSFVKLYGSGGSLGSALAISFSPAPYSSPVDAFFFLVPVADPAAPVPVAEVFASVPAADPPAAAPVVAPFVPFPVVSLAFFVPLAAIFVSVPVSSQVPVGLGPYVHFPLAVSYSSHFPSWLYEFSKFRTVAQTVYHAHTSFFNSIILLS